MCKGFGFALGRMTFHERSFENINIQFEIVTHGQKLLVKAKGRVSTNVGLHHDKRQPVGPVGSFHCVKFTVWGNIISFCKKKRSSHSKTKKVVI